MKRNLKKSSFLVLVFVGLLFFNYSDAIELSEKLRGKILLQVERNGEAWYLNPADSNRYYLGRPDDAFELMRNLGVGISNSDLGKIQIAEANFDGKDADGDGLSDMVESAIGTDLNKKDSDGDGFGDKEEILKNFNPLGLGDTLLDKNFATKQSGKIFLQVESNGEAWYVSPSDSKRYYLGRPNDAFSIMRSLGLGISNSDLDKIGVKQVGTLGYLQLMEQDVHDKVNEQRVLNGLSPVKWNSELADVARRHSLSLAKENESLINFEVDCSLPIIHHENLDRDFGLHNYERLVSSKIFYFSATAENIALIPSIKSASYQASAQKQEGQIDDCILLFNNYTDSFKSKIKAEENGDLKIKIIQEELLDRANVVASQPAISLTKIQKNSTVEIEDSGVIGWMNSPGHRKNILTAGYDEAGVGIVEVESYYIITQVFITRAKCGYRNGKCCEQEGYYPYCYQPYNCINSECKEQDDYKI